jgi:hypothetical protein
MTPPVRVHVTADLKLAAAELEPPPPGSFEVKRARELVANAMSGRVPNASQARAPTNSL